MSNVKTRLSRIVTVPAGDEKLKAVLRSPPSVNDNMKPNNLGVQIRASIPFFSTRVSAHPITAVKRERGVDVVAYWSVHIDEAVSELAVRRDHSCQGRPEVIEDFLRILIKHAAPTGEPRP